MAGPLMSRPPTCLACLRRLAQPFAHGSGGPVAVAVSLVQARAKSNRLRPRDQGVIVRLLEDIPKFGRKDAVFRIERGRMRNEWYPHKKAEYMTTTRFRELGLSRGEIGERDAGFGVSSDEDFEDVPESVVPTPAVALTTSPERAHSILTTLIPPVLTFHRKPIPAPAPMPAPAAISPLVAHANPGTATAPDVPVAIYGSVSVTDIVGYIKGALAEDAAGSRIVLAPGDILFVGLAKETDRLKELGRWEVDISVGAPGLEPVRKVVEVIASVEASVEGEPQPAL